MPIPVSLDSNARRVQDTVTALFIAVLQDVFVINSGDHCYVYVGKNASVDERKNGLSYGSVSFALMCQLYDCVVLLAGITSKLKLYVLLYFKNYLNKTEFPWLPISVIAEGKENEAFMNAMAA